jgi:thioredoxin reductase
MSKQIDVAIIGSGPYGLSLAVYLQKKKVDVAIFGKAMGTWRHQMPASMSLKSEGFASNLYHPDGLFTLGDFCAENGIEYADMGVPVQLSTFSAYGLAFQKRFVPFLNENLVTDLEKTATGFHLTLENGDTVEARRVVVAAGITHFKYLPPVLAELPSQFVSHSSRHHRMDHLKERDVVVVGAGSSAIDVAVTLHDAGARAQIITRRASIPFHGKAPLKRPLMTRLRAPWSGLGPSWRSRLACDLPLLFHIMPPDFRERVVRKHLGPAAGWSTREKIESNVALHLSSSLVGASVQDQKVHLQLRDANNETREVVADHVIAGTGYKVDLLRLPFLGQSLFNDIQLEQTSPILSSNFESSVSGLYFIGTCAALSFGPLLRFTFGAGFTSPRLSRHLASHSRRSA